MLFLSGGTGTPKLLRGFKSVIDESEIKVVVNTADDIKLSGNLICPDIDSVLYTLAGIIDDEKWWGIEGDTFVTHNYLNEYDESEFMKIGDRDRATHIARTKLLNMGKSLTETTEIMADRMNIKATITPMTDDEVSTYIKTGEKGELHFQRWWVQNQGKGKIEEINFKGLEKASPSSKFKKMLKEEKKLIIGPSNPITSIYPIISLGDIRERLRNEVEVVAISPMIGEEPVSGPARKLMEEFGLEPNSNGILSFYQDFLDTLIVDEKDLNPPRNCITLDTLMNNPKKEIKLAEAIYEEIM
ncbi:MAG: LPPG:FO 2-phospho-L-lactate transferase F420 biosynthesis enzyme CofD [Candidatus Methanohalarchaeum thermophilum]|uniref:LPPG:FO 2-phospho-L-lactate transferase F420 biosynthesis enzyme CofD n=1 Tax=Methanohalarchaeum thermophilum TaxID=1903181 RepID=A0A1Q6DXQ8_METT1|nr:MAG: LPPG:FO 2-phospho-L-lactate transferase F420 biosynthesis enzyme CofD [Candidatus Methanohalarchaeum thermophilum]